MTETKTYSAMLYALADEMRREEGCVTESPELVEQAATDERQKANARCIDACVNACKGVTNEQLEMDAVAFVEVFNERNTLKRQRDKLLAALNLIEVDKDGDGFICREAMEQVREAIAHAEGADA